MTTIRDLRRTIAFASLTFAAILSLRADNREFSLEAVEPGFWHLFDRKAQLTRVATGFGFTEGPVWDPSGYLWVSDETLNKIFKVNTVTGQKQEIISLGDPDGNTYDRQHRLLDCASVLRAIIRLSPDGKTYSTVVDRYQGKRLNSPNDVVLGPDGAIYFTDPTSDLPKDQKQEIPFKGVYRIAADGQLQLLTKDLEDPNGLAFSPDGTKVLCRRLNPTQHPRLRFQRWPPEQRTHLRRRAGRQRRRRTGWHEGRSPGEPICSWPKGHMGLVSGRPSSGNHRGAGATCEPCLGRPRLLDPLHHCDYFCV